MQIGCGWVLGINGSDIATAAIAGIITVDTQSTAAQSDVVFGVDDRRIDRGNGVQLDSRRNNDLSVIGSGRNRCQDCFPISIGRISRTLSRIVRQINHVTVT